MIRFCKYHNRLRRLLCHLRLFGGRLPLLVGRFESLRAIALRYFVGDLRLPLCNYEKEDVLDMKRKQVVVETIALKRRCAV